MSESESARLDPVLISQLFERFPLGIALYRAVDEGRDFEFVSINDTGARMNDVDPASLMGRRLRDAFPGVERMGFVDLLRQVWISGEPGFLPLRKYEDPTRAAKWFENRVHRLPDGTLLALYDQLTDRQLIERAIHQDRSLYERGPVVAFVLHEIGQRLNLDYISGNVRSLLGYEADALMRGEPALMDLVEPGGRDAFQAALRGLFDADTSTADLGPHEFLSADGTPRWMLVRLAIAPNGSSHTLDGYLVDVTKFVAANNAPHESEARYRLLTESSLDGVWEWEPARHRLALSPRWKSQIGYAEHELPDAEESFFARLHPDDVGAVQAHIQDYLQTESGHWEHEFRLKHRDGGYRWILARGAAVRGPSGWVERMMGVHIDLTERKQAEADLLRYRAIVSVSTDQMSYLSPQLRYLTVNQACAAKLDLEPDQIVGQHVRETLDPEVFDEVLEPRLNQALAGENVAYRQEVALPDANAPITLDIRYFPHFGEGRRVLGLVVCARDITREVAAERRVRQAAVVFESTHEGVMVTDPEARILSVNPAFTHLTGYGPEDVIGATPALLKSGRHDAAFYRAMWRSMADSGTWQGEIWNRRKDGSLLPEWLTISTVRDDQGAPIQYVAVFADISLLKASEKELEHLARHDPLTGLNNRGQLLVLLEQAVGRAAREDHPMGILFIDLDRFKNVNDTKGHAAGDALLQAVAGRLSTRLRRVDSLARLGGDEFIVICENVTKEHELAVLARDMIELVQRPFHLPPWGEIYVGASVGIAICPTDGPDVQTLMRHADTAMYRSKELGRNTFSFYTPELSREVHRRMELEGDLRRALRSPEQFFLLYQPQIDVATGRITGCEALLRWRHPQHGILGPDRFIPLAEEIRLMPTLSDRVMRMAFAQSVAWAGDGLRLRMAINLSAAQVGVPGLADCIGGALEEAGLAPEWVEIELTETALLEQTPQVQTNLRDLAELGVTLALDDFGTGYSSLSHLSLYDIQALKVDRSFVAGIETNPNDAEIANAIITLAHALDMRVVAEGVETQGQLDFLRARGCESYQGYLTAPPLEPEDFVRLARRVWE